MRHAFLGVASLQGFAGGLIGVMDHGDGLATLHVRTVAARLEILSHGALADLAKALAEDGLDAIRS